MLFLFPVGSQPQEVAAFQESPTSVHVFWEVPEPIGQTTGYRIYYTSSSATSSGSVLVDDPLTNNEFVHSLMNGETYTFSVAGRSIHLESEPSTAVNLPISLRKFSTLTNTSIETRDRISKGALPTLLKALSLSASFTSDVDMFVNCF